MQSIYERKRIIIRKTNSKMHTIRALQIYSKTRFLSPIPFYARYQKSNPKFCKAKFQNTSMFQTDMKEVLFQTVDINYRLISRQAYSRAYSKGPFKVQSYRCILRIQSISKRGGSLSGWTSNTWTHLSNGISLTDNGRELTTKAENRRQQPSALDNARSPFTVQYL